MKESCFFCWVEFILQSFLLSLGFDSACWLEMLKGLFYLLVILTIEVVESYNVMFCVWTLPLHIFLRCYMGSDHANWNPAFTIQVGGFSLL